MPVSDWFRLQGLKIIDMRNISMEESALDFFYNKGKINRIPGFADRITSEDVIGRPVVREKKVYQRKPFSMSEYKRAKKNGYDRTAVFVKYRDGRVDTVVMNRLIPVKELQRSFPESKLAYYSQSKGNKAAIKLEINR